MGFLLLKNSFIFYRPLELCSIRSTKRVHFLALYGSGSWFVLLEPCKSAVGGKVFSSKCEAPFVLVKMRKMFVFLVAATVLAAFVLATKPTRESELLTVHERSPPAMTISRKLKNGNSQSPKANKNRVAGKIDLLDYHPIDPAPSAKAAIKSGPIEHGVPLMPYNPQPSPPNHPKHIGESP